MSHPNALLSGAFAMLALLPGAGPPADAAPRRLAQTEMSIPTEAELGRLDRETMRGTIPDPEADMTGSIESQDQSMDRRAHEVDERVLRGICGGCD